MTKSFLSFFHHEKEINSKLLQSFCQGRKITHKAVCFFPHFDLFFFNMNVSFQRQNKFCVIFASLFLHQIIIVLLQSCRDYLSHQGANAEAVWKNLIRTFHPVNFLPITCYITSMMYAAPRWHHQRYVCFNIYAEETQLHVQKWLWEINSKTNQKSYSMFKWLPKSEATSLKFRKGLSFKSHINQVTKIILPMWKYC